MGSSCCSSLHSDEKVMIQASSKITNQFHSNTASGKVGNTEAIFQQEQNVKLKGIKGIQKEDLHNLLNNQYSTIERKFKLMADKEEKKIEDEIRAISEKNEKINKQREEKRLEREKKMKERKESGLNSLSDDSQEERSRSRRETYNALKEQMKKQKLRKLRRSKTAINDDQREVSPPQQIQIQIPPKKEGEFDKYQFLRQSTHREASPKKGLLKRSKTSNCKGTGRKVKFCPPKVKLISKY